MIQPDVRAFHNRPFSPVPLLGEGVGHAFTAIERFAYRPHIRAREGYNAGKEQWRAAVYVGRGGHDAPARTIPVLGERASFRVTRRPNIVRRDRRSRQE